METDWRPWAELLSNQNGGLKDESTRQLIRRLLVELVRLATINPVSIGNAG
ncbi:MAG: hypothetical protein NT159_11845 [Proteobacteria bacterium]|nr:hypothetical protein [Pseudomonadota bacterium]